jgi:hypothetical protein
LTSYYIFISSPDVPGILQALFQEIASNRGNITHFRQDTQLVNNKKDTHPFANIHLIATWDIEQDSVPVEESLINKIRNVFIEDLYRYKNEEDIKMITVRVEKRDDPVKILARYIIDFFDEKGMAGKIVKIFSKRNLSVIESHYRQISRAKTSDNKSIGKIILYANISNHQDILEVIASDIKGIKDVFQVKYGTVDGDYSL